MKVIALVSGGKDSCYNMVQCVAAGHEITAIAHLTPPRAEHEEIDSQMYQTVGSSAVEKIAEAMELPFFSQEIKGTGKSTDRDYLPTEGDEVEDLFLLLERAKAETGAQAVSVGAILSDYQRVRVESVCIRLSLTVLAFLWRRDQTELLREMVTVGMKCIIIKVACMGLHAKHLGLTLGEMDPVLVKLNSEYGVNVCGEGGEYETFTLDSPLFKKELILSESKIVNHSNDAFAPVTYLQLNVHLKDKSLPPNISQQEMLARASIPDISPLAYVQDVLNSITENMPELASDEHPSLEEVNFTQKPFTVREDSPGPGWVEFLNIAGRGQSPDAGVNTAFTSLKAELAARGLDLGRLVRVILYVGEMSDYAAINAAYVKHLGLNPPVRVCVAVGARNLPQGVFVVLSARAVCGEEEEEAAGCCLHVQGLSQWAPANIGPYSQGYRAQNRVHVSGQIGLIPGSMMLADSVVGEARLALRHSQRVIEALSSSPTQPQQITEASCYVTEASDVECVVGVWQASHPETELKLFLVSGLPRGARVEWEIVSRTTT